MPARERSIVFIDGNNLYHSLIAAGVTDLMQLNYAKISAKIIGTRDWIATRYYIGQVKQQGNTYLYSEQRKFVSGLQNTDRRISVHFGRLEPRKIKNTLADELKRFAANLPHNVDSSIYSGLINLANQYQSLPVMVEKAVDVMLAVDLVTMADNNNYDTAYILSADGDYTPAVNYVMAQGKKVFAASTSYGAELAKAVHMFIPLDASWFNDCY